MTNQVTTRTCPDCRTIFRHRGQDRCPRCGHHFETVQTAQSDAPQPVSQRPAVVDTPAPPPPPPPPPPPTAPVYESTSELDALLLPYSVNADYRSEAPIVEAPVESTIPPLELPPEPVPEPQVVQNEQPRVPIPGSTHHIQSTDPVDEALAGEHLVPADARRTHARRHTMPWYLRRETLIGLALVAVVLIAIIVQLAS